MIDIITLINSKINDFVWGVPAMVLILGVGLWLSCRSKFVQITKFGTAMRATIGRIFRREDAQAGAVTPFQAVCTALAATVGTGNRTGRSRCRLLDVGQCPARYVYQVCRSHAGCALP